MKYFTQLNFPELPNVYEELMGTIIDRGIEWKQHQICLTTTVDEPDNPHHGCGSLVLDWDNYVPPKDEAGNAMLGYVPRRVNPPVEEDFTQVCDQFIGSQADTMIALVQEHYKIGRVRLMKMSSKQCLSWHYDDTRRIHYPLLTDVGAQMVIGDEVLHMPKGTWWMAETLNQYHTAFNGTKGDRIHMVFSVIPEKSS